MTIPIELLFYRSDKDTLVTILDISLSDNLQGHIRHSFFSIIIAIIFFILTFYK